MATPQCFLCGSAVTVRTSFGWRCCGCHHEWDGQPDALNEEELLLIYGIDLCRKQKVDASFENLMRFLGLKEVDVNRVGRSLYIRDWVQLRSDMDRDRVFIPAPKLRSRMQWA